MAVQNGTPETLPAPLGLSALAAPPAEWPALSWLETSIVDIDVPVAEPRPLEEHNPKPYDYGVPDGISNRYKVPTLQAQVKKVKTPGPKQVTRTTPQYREAASAWWAPKLAHRKKMQKIARTHRAKQRRDKHTNTPIQVGVNQMLESLPKAASEPVTGPSGVIRGRSPKR